MHRKQPLPDFRRLMLTTANVCCIAGAGLVLYSAFLVHPSLGIFMLGLGLMAFGVVSYRINRKPGSGKPR